MSKILKGKFEPWGKNAATFIPTEMEEFGCTFETKFTSEKVKKDDDGKEYKSSSSKVIVHKGSDRLGTFWVDSTSIGVQKEDLTIFDRGICDIKEGKLVNVKGE